MFVMLHITMDALFTHVDLHSTVVYDSLSTAMATQHPTVTQIDEQQQQEKTRGGQEGMARREDQGRWQGGKMMHVHCLAPWYVFFLLFFVLSANDKVSSIRMCT